MKLRKWVNVYWTNGELEFGDTYDDYDEALAEIDFEAVYAGTCPLDVTPEAGDEPEEIDE